MGKKEASMGSQQILTDLPVSSTWGRRRLGVLRDWDPDGRLQPPPSLAKEVPHLRCISDGEDGVREGVRREGGGKGKTNSI